MSNTFAGRSVLVTGAGGSIGARICSQVISDNADRLVLVSLTEAGLYNIDRHLRQQYGKYRDTKLVPVLGDFGYSDLIREHIRGIDLVVHAGAHKHVPICESNPLAAIQNNVIGTHRLMIEAVEAGVRQFVVISSDKAVKPSSIMGATKRVVELLANEMGANGKTRFLTVRFGNVMDSAGSVLPLWREQIQAGGPITLTDERCERYFMSIADAVGLICDVVGADMPAGTYVLDMGHPRKLVDIAHALMSQMGRVVDIAVTGLRPGEKVTEELHHGGKITPTGMEKVLRVEPPPRLDHDMLASLERACVGRHRSLAVEALWALAS